MPEKKWLFLTWHEHEWEAFDFQHDIVAKAGEADGKHFGVGDKMTTVYIRCMECGDTRKEYQYGWLPNSKPAHPPAGRTQEGT